MGVVTFGRLRDFGVAGFRCCGPSCCAALAVRNSKPSTISKTYMCGAFGALDDKGKSPPVISTTWVKPMPPEWCPQTPGPAGYGAGEPGCRRGVVPANLVAGEALCRRTWVSAICTVGEALCRRTWVSASCSVGKPPCRPASIPASRWVGKPRRRQVAEPVNRDARSRPGSAFPA